MIKIDEKFNWARVVIGGLFAGIAMNVIAYIVAIPNWNPDYEYLRDRQFLVQVPIHPYFEIKMAGVLILGILLGWLYAVARHRLGRGAKTALTVGAIVGFIAAVPSALFQAAWNPVPELSPLWVRWLVGGWIEVMVGTFIAAAIYSEDEDEVEEEEILPPETDRPT